MQFLIADTFTDSLGRLTGDEQKAVKTTAFDLQMNPAAPGHKFHKLDRAKDKNFWSIRVSGDIRMIVHRSADSLLICYVDHHDKAYEWARRRKLETHPKTGAAQMVVVRESIEKVQVPAAADSFVSKTQPKRLFAKIEDDALLGVGVPPEWLPEVRLATEDTLLRICVNLPEEAGEALLELATTGKMPRPKPVAATAEAKGKTSGSGQEPDPFAHPDARRRFRIVSDLEELERALDSPWDRWIVFLHPEQRQIVERNYAGPARVAGSAGTGKTIVALHRAVYLARTNPDARILLTTFSDALANALSAKLRRLVGKSPRLVERIDVESLQSVGLRLYRSTIGECRLAGSDQIHAMIRESAGKSRQKFSNTFLFSEWDHLVDAWQVGTWEAYRDMPRLGRKTRLSEEKREQVWLIFFRVFEELRAKGMMTPAGMFTKLAEKIQASGRKPYDFAVVDEAQDIGVAHLKFFAALGADRENALFFAGDQGQRIFQQPYSWKSLGIDVRGRSRMLKVNYRTSHQIRMKADLLLDPESTDIDGNIEDRSGTISVFDGPEPTIRTFEDEQGEAEAVGQWIAKRHGEGMVPHEIALLVRSEGQIERARRAVELASLPNVVLDERVETLPGKVSIGTMHLAKGLEFRAVAVMACDDEVIPLQERIEAVGDDGDLKEVFDSERHLLYVACTRARDNLLVTGIEPESEFLDDLRSR